MDSELQASRCADSCQMSPRSPVLGQDGLAEWDASGSGALRDEETIMSQPSLMPPDAHSREGYPGGQRTSMASYRKSRSKLLLSPAFRTGRPPLTEAGYEEAFAVSCQAPASSDGSAQSIACASRGTLETAGRSAVEKDAACISSWALTSGGSVVPYTLDMLSAVSYGIDLSSAVSNEFDVSSAALYELDPTSAVSYELELSSVISNTPGLEWSSVGSDRGDSMVLMSSRAGSR